MMRVHAAGRTDVGQVRDVNEDAYHVGDSVFAVADGMGGHVAGEVASHTALQPIGALDGRVFGDAAQARAALRDAIVAANDAVVSKAADDPSYQGMGTTLTAVLVEGRRAHIAHVGDSRAYLFRDGDFAQLTTDHTLVQRLIDEGRITREEAATHPHRSVITRAIGVEASIDVDAMTLDLEPGDMLVLCSDGLTGPVDDDTIIDLLRGEARPTPAGDDQADAAHRTERAARQLVAAANAAGGPDNITVIVLEFEELPTAPAPRKPTSAGPVVVSTRPDAGDGSDWASSLGRLGHLGGERGLRTGDGPDDGDRGPGRGPRIAVAIVVIGLLVGSLFAGSRWVLARSWYVGLEADQVVIYQGVPASVGPIDLSWKFEDTGLGIDGLPPRIVNDLRDGLPATSAIDARNQVENFRRLAAPDDEDEDADDGDDEDGATSG
jgi:PPM family protein phosphatase